MRKLIALWHKMTKNEYKIQIFCAIYGKITEKTISLHNKNEVGYR